MCAPRLRARASAAACESTRCTSATASTGPAAQADPHGAAGDEPVDPPPPPHAATASNAARTAARLPGNARSLRYAGRGLLRRQRRIPRVLRVVEAVAQQAVRGELLDRRLRARVAIAARVDGG